MRKLCDGFDAERFFLTGVGVSSFTARLSEADSAAGADAATGGLKTPPASASMKSSDWSMSNPTFAIGSGPKAWDQPLEEAP